MKKVVLCNFLALIIPFIIMSFVVAVCKADENVGYASLIMALSSFIFFESLIAVKYHKPLLMVLVLVLTMFGIVFNRIMLPNTFYGYIGLVLSPLMAFMAAKTRWLYFMGVLVIFPCVFITCDITKQTILFYIAFMCAAILYAVVRRYKRVKILLYDNY